MKIIKINMSLRLVAPHVFLSCLLLFLFVLLSTSAAQPARALTVSPVRMEVGGDPGRPVTRTIRLTNEQDETKTFYVSFENFIAQGETNKPEFTGADDDLATWITAPSQVTLEPGRMVEVPISISIPADADPGDHFAAIFWSTSPPAPAESGQVAIGGRLGVLVLLTVSGDVVREGQLIELGTDNNQQYFSMLPITFTYRLQNTGNVRLKPGGAVKIQDMFGNEVAILDANLQEGNTLPETIRKYEVVWDREEKSENADEPTGFWGAVREQISDFKIGRYTANLDLTLDESLPTASAQFGFTIIPWQLLTVGGGGLVAAALILWLLLRLHTRRAVRKALEARR